MRSPRGLGAGPRHAAFLFTILVALLALAATPVWGSHHLEGEGEAPEAKPGKVIVIEPGEFTELMGSRRTFWASICDADGSNCKDAKKAKWAVKPAKGLALSKKKGEQVLVEGEQAGTYELTARQGGASGTATVKINEPIDLEEQAEPMPAGDEVRLYISPDEVEMGVGQTIVFTAWGCTLGPAGRLGENDAPDGFDDDCVLIDINEIRLDEGAPALVVGPEGALFSITVTAFPSDVPGDVSFIGAQVWTDVGTTLASIIANREELARFKASDGEVGDTGYLGVWGTFFNGEYDPALDINENGILDHDDWVALTGQEAGMPTPPPGWKER